MLLVVAVENFGCSRVEGSKDGEGKGWRVTFVRNNGNLQGEHLADSPSSYAGRVSNRVSCFARQFRVRQEELSGNKAARGLKDQRTLGVGMGS